MAAIGNNGELYFTLFEAGFNVTVMIGVLDRLVRHLDRKIHLIVDGHPSHRAHLLRDWLPSGSRCTSRPAAPRTQPRRTAGQRPQNPRHRNDKRPNPGRTGGGARTHLRRRQNQPERVKAFFGKQHVRYAAGQ